MLCERNLGPWRTVVPLLVAKRFDFRTYLLSGLVSVEKLFWAEACAFVAGYTNNSR